MHVVYKPGSHPVDGVCVWGGGGGGGTREKKGKLPPKYFILVKHHNKSQKLATSQGNWCNTLIYHTSIHLKVCR